MAEEDFSGLPQAYTEPQVIDGSSDETIENPRNSNQRLIELSEETLKADNLDSITEVVKKIQEAHRADSLTIEQVDILWDVLRVKRETLKKAETLIQTFDQQFALLQPKIQAIETDAIKYDYEIKAVLSELHIVIDSMVAQTQNFDLKASGEPTAQAIASRIKKASDACWTIINNISKGKNSFDRMNNIYPDRRIYLKKLAELAAGALDIIPLEKQTIEQTDEYVKALSFESPLFLLTNPTEKTVIKNGYYMFDSFSYGAKTKGRELLEKVHRDSTIDLSEEDEAIIQAEEDKTFKLHLQFKQEQWKPILKAMLEAVTKRELDLKALSQWKIINFQMVGGHYPGVVCYPRGNTKEEVVTNLKQITNDVVAVLEKAGIQLAEGQLPRYSTPIVKDGKETPGFSYVQGNGDWKEYLLGKGKLSQVYDPERNYAVKKDSIEINM